MNTIVNIKVEPKIKIKAKKIASDLGFTLSGLINAYLKQLIRTKSAFFSLNEERPTPYLLEAIKEADAERKNGRNYSFTNSKEAIKFLDK